MKTKTTKKRNALAILLTAFLVMSALLAGCGDKNTDGGDGSSNADLPTIGIVQITQHTSLDMIRESIVDQLATDGFIDGKTVHIDYQNAQNDQSNLKTICQKFSSKNYDLIIAIATPSAQVALGETTEIPIVFSAVTDPVAAGLVKTMEQPGGNITGTSDAVSASKIMELAEQITPDFKTIGAIYNSSEANSIAVIDELKKYAEEHDLTVVESSVTNSSEVQQAAAALVGKTDIVFSPIDNTIASAMPVITKTFDDAKLPFYVSADSMVMDGGLASCGIDYTVLGSETGKMVAEILNGKAPGTIDVMKMKEMKVYLNTDTASRIGIQFPENLLKDATLFTDADSAANKDK